MLRKELCPRNCSFRSVQKERATNQPCNYCKRHSQQLDEQLDVQDINLPSNCSERLHLKAPKVVRGRDGHVTVGGARGRGFPKP
mmetsp:Transcript_5452/g.7717  ORF Transcript_5452/g.7717 Transcript_5452/m.7717 type:complete len:84 (+) Transcript_5452:327-578(+)